MLRIEKIIAAAALLFSAAHANATSVPLNRVECHETTVYAETTNNVVSSSPKKSDVSVYEIDETFGAMYVVMYNEKPVYNGTTTYFKTTPLAFAYDNSDAAHVDKFMLSRITGDLSRIQSFLVNGNGTSTTVSGHCEPVTLTTKF
jgi:hypothetical protein